MLPSTFSVLTLLVGSCQGWANDWDGHLKFECPTGQSIYKLISKHDNGKEDRVWDFKCRSVGHTVERCTWSGYINEFDDHIGMKCYNLLLYEKIAPRLSLLWWTGRDYRC